LLNVYRSQRNPELFMIQVSYRKRGLGEITFSGVIGFTRGTECDFHRVEKSHCTVPVQPSVQFGTFCENQCGIPSIYYSKYHLSEGDRVWARSGPGERPYPESSMNRVKPVSEFRPTGASRVPELVGTL
jgi:hypothetical protein